jgi:hypothetical protein
MRKLILALIVGTAVWAVAPSAAQAQPGFYTGGTVVRPYAGYYGNPYTGYYAGVMPGAYSYSTYASPYGWRSYSSATTVPTPYGYSTFYNSGTSVRPYVVAPRHSVYWNPYTNSYNYGPGYNTPYYSSGFFFGY